jgi:hypothetical protein
MVKDAARIFTMSADGGGLGAVGSVPALVPPAPASGSPGLVAEALALGGAATLAEGLGPGLFVEGVALAEPVALGGFGSSAKKVA